MARFSLTRRSLLGSLAAGACAAGAGRAAAQEDEGTGGLQGPQPVQVNARTLPHFQPGRPGVRRFGDLEYRGGLVLSSPSEHFGGWSGLVMDGDGKRLLS